MSGARNWSIGKRLGAGFGAILVLVTGANLVSLSALSGSGAHLRAAQSAQLGTAALAEAQSLLWQLRWSVAQYMVIDEAGCAKIVAEEAGVGARLEEQLNAYAKLPRTAAESEALKELLAAYRKYMDARPKWFQLYGAGKLDEAKDWRAAATTPFGAATVKGFSNLIEAQKQAIAANAAAARQHADTATLTLLAAALAAAALMLFLAWWLTRSITRPVHEVREVIERAQQTSDLTLRAGDSGKDEVAAMAHAYNALMQSLQTTLRTVLASARDVSASATTVATASS